MWFTPRTWSWNIWNLNNLSLSSFTSLQDDWLLSSPHLSPWKLFQKALISLAHLKFRSTCHYCRQTCTKIIYGLEVTSHDAFTLQRNVFIVIRQIVCMPNWVFVVCFKTETFTFLPRLLLFICIKRYRGNNKLHLVAETTWSWTQYSFKLARNQFQWSFCFNFNFTGIASIHWKAFFIQSRIVEDIRSIPRESW